MILRRLADAITEQNWFTVVLEVLIVVVGIFIGLQVDDWNQTRKDTAKEMVRLAALHENIVATLDGLGAERNAAAGAIEALRILLTLDEQDLTDSQILAHLRMGFLYSSRFSPELNVYDDLKNSGELALLTSSELRQALARMESLLEVVAIEQMDLLTVQQINLDPYMLERFDLRQMLGAVINPKNVTNEIAIDIELVADIRTQNRMLMKLDIIIQLDILLEDAERALAKVRQLIASEGISG